jgi:hypothetical protein
MAVPKELLTTWSRLGTILLTFRERSVTFREHSVNIQGTFREHSGNVQCSFKGTFITVSAEFSLLASF